MKLPRYDRRSAHGAVLVPRCCALLCAVRAMPGQSQPAAQPAGRSLLRSLFILDVERLTGPTPHARGGSILYCIDSADVRVAVLLPQLDPYFWFPAPAEVKNHSDADSVAVINALARVRQCCGQHELQTGDDHSLVLRRR